MRTSVASPLVIAAVLAAATAACSLREARGSASPAGDGGARAPETVVVPKLWDDAQLAGWATPVAGLGVPPSYVSEAEYYAAPVDDLRTYPVYHPSREPAGYRESLLKRGPEPLIEPARLSTREDWIEAGRRVFEELDTAASRCDDPEVIGHFTDAASVDRYRDAGHDVMTKDGVLLDYRWVVERDGKLKVSFSSCAGCHTRVMPDGSLLRGAPSNFDVSDAPAVQRLLARLRPVPMPPLGEIVYAEHGVPWLEGDVHAQFRTMPDAAVAEYFGRGSGEPPGTMFARVNGSPFWSTRMADLRGIRHRRYLDATGTHLHRGPEDLARYGILVEFAENGEFGPHHLFPEALRRPRLRPPDAAMYAMALYLESLEPAPSPHPFDDEARRGQAVFEAQGCDDCHPPPVYTNNELVTPERVGTDPGLAFRTRKGTGHYKVPSLRGLWYRGLYEHSGSVASLEDWFDPKRLLPDYVPTGWKGPGVQTRAVPGHPFGLDLSEDEKRALIAFLMTL